MRRAVARFLLLVMLGATFAPLALAASSPGCAAHCNRPPLAARPARHHCHEMDKTSGTAQAQTSGAVFQSTSCCFNHQCCRPLVRWQWARFTPTIVGLGITPAPQPPTEYHATIRSAQVLAYRPVRAPPVL